MANADDVVIALEARTGDFTPRITQARRTFEDSMSAMERSANRAEAGVQRAATGIVASTGQIGQRTRLLGYQISDIGTQLASGASPFLILAQQAPQVANALEGTAGVAGRLAAFFSGPWGAALLAAASVVGVLTSNLLSGSDAAEKKKKATDSLQEAVDRLNGASASLNNTTTIGIANDLRAAEALRVREIRTRRQIQAQLELAQANLQGASAAALNPGSGFTPEERAGALGAASGYESQVATLGRQRAEQDAKIASANLAIRSAQAQMSLRGVASATDAATSATQRYEDRLDFLTRQFEKGYITQAQFERGATAATRSRDTSLKAVSESEKSATRATSARNKELREAERAERRAAAEAVRSAKEIGSTLDGLISKFDPARAAAIDFGKTIADIERVRLAGLVSDTEAIALRLGAAAAEAKRLADSNAAFARDTFTPGITDNGIDGILSNINKRKDADFRMANDAAEHRDRLEDESQQLREDNIRNLAYTFEELFEGGTDRLWENFKRQGLAAVALIVAQLVAAQFDKTPGTDFGSILKSGLSLFGGGSGFANGGTMQIAGRGGVDQNQLSLNGSPIAKVSRGETLAIVPQMNAASPSSASQPAIVRIEIAEGQMFEPRIAQISGDVSVQVVRAAAGPIRDSAVAETMRQASRAKM